MVPEPLGSAYRDVDLMAKTLKDSISKNLNLLLAESTANLLDRRYRKFMSMGLQYE